MMAYGLLLLVAIAGLLVGLIVGVVRRHGLGRTLLGMMVGGLAAVAFILFWLYGLGAIPGVVEAIDGMGRQYPVVRSAVSIATMLTPLAGALIGLWLLSRVRPRRVEQAVQAGV